VLVIQTIFLPNQKGSIFMFFHICLFVSGEIEFYPYQINPIWNAKQLAIFLKHPFAKAQSEWKFRASSRCQIAIQSTVKTSKGCRLESPAPKP
jgi:hypothetical protein